MSRFVPRAYDPAFTTQTRWVLGTCAFLALVAVVSLLPGCASGPTELGPIDAPRANLVAGHVFAGGTPLAAATVRLEPVRDGLPATVAATLVRTGEASRGLAKLTEEAANDIADLSVEGLRLAATDARGLFAFANVPAGEYLLTATSRDHLAGTASAFVVESPFASSLAETTFVDIALVPTGTLSGRALLATEIDHREIVVYVEGTSVVAVSRNDGEYVLRDVPVGVRDVRAMRGGYRSAQEQATLTAAGDSVRVTDLVLGIDSNLPPVITMAVAPLGDVHSPVQLNATVSDPDGTIVRYQWDFEDDGIFDSSSTTTALISHWYQTEGLQRPKLRVTDDRGGISYAVADLEIVEAIYVTASGSDQNLGTKASPVASIDRAYEVAATLSEGIPVRLAEGSYAPPASVQRNSLVGGHDPMTWTRSTGTRSVIAMGSSTLLLEDLAEMSFTGIEVRATSPNAEGHSIAMMIDECFDLHFVDCRFVAVNGASGVAGAHGSAGIALPGEDGSRALSVSLGCDFAGYCPGDGGTTILPGIGEGGNGGHTVSSYAQAEVGRPGTHGAPGGTAGARNDEDVPPTAGGNGGNAPAGAAAAGSHGSVSSWPGTFAGPVWTPTHGGPGGSGETSVGAGGGGGGGGAFSSILGTQYWSGGGGGAGGVSTGGDGGLGGLGGGSSIAVVTMLQADAFVSFTACEFAAGNAGNGGAGGNGGASALAAPGGQGGDGLSADGGNGGSSAASGNGGGGAGGAGGVSHGIYMNGFDEPTFTTCSYQFGTAGTGGLGGLRGNGANRAPSGPNGFASGIFDNVQ
jgi:hypothetical protein